MALEITRKKDGSLRSRWWYGRYEVNGIRKLVNLGVEIKGTVPKTLRELGDPLFERSRAQAQVKLDGLIFEAQSRKTAEQHLEQLYELKSGCDLMQIPLKDMEREWDMLPSKKGRSKRYIESQHAAIRQFREFLNENHASVKYMSQVTPPMARGWMYALEKEGASGGTYNRKLNCYKQLFRPSSTTGVARNPFDEIPTHMKKAVHRQPFTPDELKTMIDCCDPILRPVFITGMCTAMRRGDCCLLKWESVDLDSGFITVRTSKTGETAEIPLFPILRETILQQSRTSEYVFPEAAKMIQHNRQGLTWRIKKALEAANIEGQVKVEGRMRPASVKDFHSLRTTWITMALTAGVPMELVRRVTGHATVEVVLEHYFRPGRDVFREALQNALPSVITGDTQLLTPPEELDPTEAIKKLAERADELQKEHLVAEIKRIAEQMAA